jgi:serine/threonine protein kinase
MSVNAIGDRTTGSSATQPETTASELIDGVGLGESFDARSILRRNPQAANERSTVVDLAYEEYCRKTDAGEQLDIRAFAARFPDIQQSLIRVLEVHEYLEQNPESTLAEFSPQWPEVGDDFLGFSLVAELGHGAFSRVFLAEEAELGNRQVVVKICEYTNGEPARLGQLKHPGIVPVYSVQTQVPGGLTAICMPFLGTATLADVMEEAFRDHQQPVRGSLVLAATERASCRHAPPQEDGEVPRAMRRGSYGDAVVELGAQVCDALAYSHEKWILHCDVKPSNILLTAKGQSKLFDFNLSRQRGGGQETIGGTLPYMAPEQVKCLIDAKMDGSSSIDQRTDLFSLGVMLFQLLTGKLPFSVDGLTGSRKRDASNLLAKQRDGAVSVTELGRVVDPSTARLILDCLAFEPDARPDSAASVARDLRSSLTLLARAKRWVRSHKIVTATIVLTLFVAAAALGYYFATRPSLANREYARGEYSMEHGDDAGATPHYTAAIAAGFQPAEEAFLWSGWSRWRAAKRDGITDAERAQLRSIAYEDFLNSYGNGESSEAAASLGYRQSQPDMDEYASAAQHFKEAIEAGFITPSILNNLAVCDLLVFDEPETASLDLEEAVRLDPNELVPYLNLLMCDLKLIRRAGKPTEYIENAGGHIEDARRLDSDSIELEFRAACVYAAALDKAETWEKAKIYRSKVLESCERALELGLDRVELETVRIYGKKALKDDEQFNDLLMNGPAPNEQFNNLGNVAPPNLKSVILMDVYPDIRARLTGNN